MKRKLLVACMLVGLCAAAAPVHADPLDTIAPVNTRAMVIGDFDSDGDDDSVVLDATLQTGQARERIVEIVGNGCNSLPEPQRTACKIAFAACDLLPEPARTACRDALRKIFFTTWSGGIGKNVGATAFVQDVDGDGEIEAVILGAGHAPGVDTDRDFDIDIAWL